MPSACPPCSTPLLSDRSYLLKADCPGKGNGSVQAAVVQSVLRCAPLEGIVAPKGLYGGLRLDAGRKDARRRQRREATRTRERSFAADHYDTASRWQDVARIRRRRGSGWLCATGQSTVSRTSADCILYTLLGIRSGIVSWVKIGLQAFFRATGRQGGKNPLDVVTTWKYDIPTVFPMAFPLSFHHSPPTFAGRCAGCR
jgi:hypothetical protein